MNLLWLLFAVLGIGARVTNVTLNGAAAGNFSYDATADILTVQQLRVDLRQPFGLQWTTSRAAFAAPSAPAPAVAAAGFAVAAADQTEPVALPAAGELAVNQPPVADSGSADGKGDW